MAIKRSCIHNYSSQKIFSWMKLCSLLDMQKLKILSEETQTQPKETRPTISLPWRHTYRKKNISTEIIILVIRRISRNIQITKRTACTELALKRQGGGPLSHACAWKKWLQRKQNGQRTTTLSKRERNGKSGYITTDSDEHPRTQTDRRKDVGHSPNRRTTILDGHTCGKLCGNSEYLPIDPRTKNNHI